MGVEQLEIRDFRCLAAASISPHPDINLISGANGSGKTSILECVHVLGAGKSFRVREFAPLVRHGQAAFDLRARTSSPHQVLEAHGATGGLELRLNDQALRSGAEIAAVLPVQALFPEMHALIEGSPDGRRRFIDWGAFHVKRPYLEIWRNFRRALRQRNAALKSAIHRRDLPIWDGEFVRAGELVDFYRQDYVLRLSAEFREISKTLLKETTELRYRRGWPAERSLAQAVDDSTERDLLFKATQVGPHRADLDIRFDAASARHLASRGQQKMLAMSLGLAQARIIATSTSRRMVLLLDDPVAEIDREGAEQLAGEVSRIPAQRFITGLGRDRYPGNADREFHVERGEVREVI